jgi:ribosome maturation factor RimP
MASQVPQDERRTPSAEGRTSDPAPTRGEERRPSFGVRASEFGLPADLIAAAARDTGVEVYHAEISGRELRVQVESASGASVRACSEFSHALTTRLDATDYMRRQYTLEVSTPGIERRLYRPQDYAKALNHHVKVLVRDGWVEGRLEATGPNGITVKVQAPNAERRTSDGELTREIAYGEIREAHIRVPDCELFASGTGKGQGPKESRNQVMHSNPRIPDPSNPAERN